MFLHVDHIIEDGVGFGNGQLIIIYFMQKSFSRKVFQFFVRGFNYFSKTLKYYINFVKFPSGIFGTFFQIEFLVI